MSSAILGFFLGSLFGVVVAYGATIISLYFYEEKSIASVGVKRIKEALGEGWVGEPPSNVEDAMRDVFERNEKDGKDTPMSEVL